MAKKHKTIKRARPVAETTPQMAVSPANTGRYDAWSMAVLGAAVLALIGGVLAVYGGVADGSNTSMYTSSDIMATVPILRDVYGESDYHLSGWRTGVSRFLFPDYFLLHAGYIANLGSLSLFRFYGIALVIISTIGWIMVANKVFGRSLLVWSFVVMATALHLVVMSFGTADVFSIGFFTLRHHNGLWAILPYLLWSLLVISETAKPNIWQTAGFAVLLGLSWFSDVIVIVWFILPMAGVLLFAFFAAPARVRCWRHLLAAVIVAYVIRWAISSVWPFDASLNTQRFTSFNPAQSTTTLLQMLSTVGDFAAQHPAVFFSWLMFFVLLTAAIIIFIRTARKPKSKRQDIDNATMVALFFALSAAAAPAAAVATGTNIFGATSDIATKTRYLHPTMFLPLFAGWVFLLAFLWRLFPSLRVLTVRQTQWAAVALSVLLVAFAAPKVAALVHDDSRLRLFDLPFFACLQETAQRRNLHAGVASFLFDHPIAAASINKRMGIERMARIGNLNRLGLGERGNLYVSQDTTNRYYEQGDFDFAVVNAHQGTVHLSPWPNESNVCADEGRLSCIEPVAYGFIIDGQAVEDEFGKPAEIVDCGPAALYLYDKPFNLHGLLRG